MDRITPWLYAAVFLIAPFAFHIGWKISEAVAGTWLGAVMVAAIVVLVILLLWSAVTGDYAAIEWAMEVIRWT